MALSGAYYAMLYAIRAALSERDVYAKTHRGAWNEFGRFVATGEFDGDLVAAAQRVQSQREDADYDAWLVPRDEAAARDRARRDVRRRDRAPARGLTDVALVSLR